MNVTLVHYTHYLKHIYYDDIEELKANKKKFTF
jgi:hypothetical protein